MPREDLACYETEVSLSVERHADPREKIYYDRLMASEFGWATKLAYARDSPHIPSIFKS